VAKGEDIEERLIEFAVRIIRLSGHLPNTEAGKHVGRQLLRSGTAPAAHYAEARGAESKRDFIHKLRICLKELNETSVWLRIVSGSDMVAESRLQGITGENVELGRITNASIRTTLSSMSR
jgi:four helix bundle protein